MVQEQNSSVDDLFDAESTLEQVRRLSGKASGKDASSMTEAEIEAAEAEAEAWVRRVNTC